MVAQKIEKKSMFCNLFTINIVLLPVMNVYSIHNTMIGVVTTILLDIFATLILCTKVYSNSFFRNDKLTKYISTIVMFLLFTSAFSIIYEPNILINKILGRSFLLLLYTYTLFLCKYFINYSLALKCFRIVGLAIIIGTIIQLASYYFVGKVIQLYLPGLSTTIEGLNERWVVDSGFFRPKSIFNESSHVAYYLSLLLCIELFINAYSNIIYTVVFSIGLLLTVSGTGISVLIVIWVVYLVSKKNFKLLIKVLSGAVLVYLIISGVGLLDHVSYSFSRIETDSNRFTSFIDVFQQMNGAERFFGTGMGNTTIRFSSYYLDHNSFMSGFGRIIVEGGLVAGIIYSVIMIKLLLEIEFPKKAFLILFIILNMIENIFFGWYIVLFLMWLYIKIDNVEKNNIV